MSNENTTSNDWQEREIGALWNRNGSNQKYLSGKLKLADGSTLDVVIFSNKYKNADNQPDFRVYKGTPANSQQTSNSNEKAEAVEEGIL